MTKRYFSILVIATVSLSSCGKKGCTDSKASNYDWEAKRDDKSCKYEGCTDVNALNYNSNAQTDNGSCSYYGYVRFYSTLSDGDYATINFNDSATTFSISKSCPIVFADTTTFGIICEDQDPNCNYMEIPNLEPKTYTYTGTVYDNGVPKAMPLVSVNVKSGECRAVLIGY